MLTRYGYYKILDDIFATGGLTDKMKETILKLKSDFDEREGMLKKYGEVYDGEGEKEEYEYKEYEQKDNTYWKQEYDKLFTEYRHAFIYGVDKNVEHAAGGAEIIEEVDTPEENKDETVKEFEDMIRESED